jgi:hypothetical protein
VKTAAANKAAQATVQLDSANGDVQVGNYDRPSATFTANTAPYNSVRVLARRTADSPAGALNLIFAPIFGVSTSDVSRSAVAMAGGQLPAGVILLDPTRPSSLGGNGTPRLILPQGSVQVNSSDTSAVRLAGTVSVSAAELRVTGAISAGSNNNLPTKVYTGATPVPDPLASIPAPALGTTLTATASPLNPGYYPNGVTVPGGQTWTMNAGIYELGSPGLVIGNGAALTANGVMLYLTSGTVSTQYGTISLGNGTLPTTITPPTSGIYAGISIFADRSTPYSNTLSLTGNSQLTLTGVIYAPSLPISLSGTSDFTVGNQIIAATASLSGTNSITVAYDGRNPVTINNVFLVR